MDKNNEMVSRYRKYFQNWDKNSSVRSKPNNYHLNTNYLKNEFKNKKWFLPNLLPIFSHPLLKNLGMEEEQFLLGFFLLQFLEYGTLLEHEFVNTILAELALGETGIPIPECMRVDAFKIYTDEGYHALFNLEATQKIREYIGITTENVWPLKNSRLDAMRALIPEEHSRDRFLIRFGLVAISETVANKELTENMKGIVIDSIYHIFNDHAEDEKKHCMYFSTLWEVVWNYLSEKEKILLGTYIPKILKTFITVNKYGFKFALAKLGFKDEIAEKIINDCYPKSSVVDRAYSVASVSFRIFQRLNIFALPQIRNAFIHEGFTQDLQ